MLDQVFQLFAQDFVCCRQPDDFRQHSSAIFCCRCLSCGSHGSPPNHLEKRYLFSILKIADSAPAVVILRSLFGRKAVSAGEGVRKHDHDSYVSRTGVVRPLLEGVCHHRYLRNWAARSSGFAFQFEFTSFKFQCMFLLPRRCCRPPISRFRSCVRKVK